MQEMIPFIVMRLNIPFRNRKTDQLIRTRNLLPRILSMMGKHDIVELIITSSLITIQTFQPCNFKQTELNNEEY